MDDTEPESTPDAPALPVKRSRSTLRGKTAEIQRVLRAVADGASVREATKAEGVSRQAFLRLVEKHPQYRERFATSLAMRAHALSDEMVAIADGRESATELAAAIAAAVKAVAPEYAEATLKFLIRDATQRDRLRVDTRKWIASRLLPAVYGPHATPSISAQTITVKFDQLPVHPVLPPPTTAPIDAVWEILDESDPL